MKLIGLGKNHLCYSGSQGDTQRHLHKGMHTLTPTMDITFFNNCSVPSVVGSHPRGVFAKFRSQVHDLTRQQNSEMYLCWERDKWLIIAVRIYLQEPRGEYHKCDKVHLSRSCLSCLSGQVQILRGFKCLQLSIDRQLQVFSPCEDNLEDGKKVFLFSAISTFRQKTILDRRCIARDREIKQDFPPKNDRFGPFSQWTKMIMFMFKWQSPLVMIGAKEEVSIRDIKQNSDIGQHMLHRGEVEVDGRAKTAA